MKHDTQYVTRPKAEGLYDPQFESDSCGTGFIVNVKGQASRSTVEDALCMLCRMDHRGARGADVDTGDGVGILTSMPHKFFARLAKEHGVNLPSAGGYAAGNVFLPQDDALCALYKQKFEALLKKQKLQLLWWRAVPTDNSTIGKGARACEPVIEQVFITSSEAMERSEFEHRCYVLRKSFTAECAKGDMPSADGAPLCYLCSLSSQTIVYKGMLTTEQLERYYEDLAQEDFEAYMALIHSRFSTNTFPSWDRAQPFRMMSHNGEINTWYGNMNKMHAREGVMRGAAFGDDLESLYPIIEKDVSDSGAFDNTLEFLYNGGYSLSQAICMMIPEAWQHSNHMDSARKAMYQAYSCVMEPWDGPACITFTDGRYVGAVIDRNGLRPSRYYITNDDRVILASEFGVVDVDPKTIVTKDRLQPGRVFLIDTQRERIITDEDIKTELASMHPYEQWMKEERVDFDALRKNADALPSCEHLPHEERVRRCLAYGYSEEDKFFLIKPMVENGKDPLGSMGNDVALACLSETPRLLYDYFKQWFAQVTNPPIDSIRERVIMSLGSFIGPEQNVLEPQQGQCHKLWIDTPILSHQEFALIREIDHRAWRSKIIDITYEAQAGESGLDAAIERICAEAEAAAAEGVQCLILSDRAMDERRMSMSTLLGVSAAHHHLVAKSLRSRSALILETAEAREVHHFCMLVGYGADAIFPYLALETAFAMRDAGDIDSAQSNESIVAQYKKAVDYGMCKVFAKMGISTIDSYRGAQIFEAVGIGKVLIERCFSGTVSRIGGIGLAELHREMHVFHSKGYTTENVLIGENVLNLGNFQWRKDGNKHMWDPESIALLQHAVRSNDASKFNAFVERQNQRSKQQATIRGLLKYRASSPVPLEKVESAADIVTRFVTGAMSFGSLSQEAHETLAIAMNRIGGKSNTGEGGELAERYVRQADGTSKRSAIKQVASGRFGVTIEYLSNADEIQIKMAQGAKPGEGGELPGHKVFTTIAQTRHSTPGIGLISPPPHHDIYSIEDLAQLIYDLKNANPQARISVKLVSKAGVGVIAAGVTKGKADHILISGHDGGTGASALTSIKHAGLPWELGIAETHQVLVKNNLRDRVILQTDGQLKTGRDIAIAAMLGAEEFGFATSALIAMGCIMMRKCEKNTCPVGIATQDEKLRAKFTGTPEHVVRFMLFLAEDLRKEMAALGFKRIEEMVGRSDMLEGDESVLHWKSRTLDLSALLGNAEDGLERFNQCCSVAQNHALDAVIDRRFVEDARDVLENNANGAKRMEKHYRLENTQRATGTILSHHVAQRYGLRGLPEDTIRLMCEGHAGQSFGAFLAHGITMHLCGDANDYVGKGLSGGVLVVTPPQDARFVPEQTIIVGNVVLYGAILGKAFFRGRAAERFCIRNSGAKVVVEGLGAHGCEYMTGGRVVILGGVGMNFAAGMSGGIAYVWDASNTVREYANAELEIDALNETDEAEVHELVLEHAKRTQSSVAQNLLSNWEDAKSTFVRVIAPEYRRILEIQRGEVIKEIA